MSKTIIKRHDAKSILSIDNIVLLFTLTGSVASILYIIFRLFHFLDFTDEMQHIGEMVSLVENGHFFANDYFLQQVGYIFLYPILKIYNTIFPAWDYFVFFNRSFLAGLIILAALAAYRSIKKNDGGYIPALAAAVLVICIPQSSIMSINYNSLSIILCIILISTWYDKVISLKRTILQAGVLSVLFFVHPVLSVAGAIMFAVDLARRKDIKQLIALGSLSLCLTLITMLIMVGGGFILSTNDLIDAFDFTKSFEVGIKILRPDHMRQLIIAVTTVVGCLIVMNNGSIQQPIRKKVDKLTSYTPLVVLLTFLTLIVLTFITLKYHTAIFIRLLFLASIVFCAIYITNQDQRIYVTRLGVAGLVFALAFSIASGNGMFNFGLGAGIALPFIISVGVLGAVGANYGENTEGPARWIASLLCFFIITSALLHPYREDYGWNLNSQIDIVPAFKGIRTASIKREMSEEMLAHIGDFNSENKTVMVLGPHPWLYFHTKAQANTPMLFMHFPDSDDTLNFISRKIGERPKPDIIVVAAELPLLINNTLDRLVDSGYLCKTTTVEGRLIKEFKKVTHAQLPTDLRICTAI